MWSDSGSLRCRGIFIRQVWRHSNAVVHLSPLNVISWLHIDCRAESPGKTSDKNERYPVWIEEIKLEGEWGRWIYKGCADLNRQNKVTHPCCVCVTWNYCLKQSDKLTTCKQTQSSTVINGRLFDQSIWKVYSSLQTKLLTQLWHNYTCQSFGHFKVCPSGSDDLAELLSSLKPVCACVFFPYLSLHVFPSGFCHRIVTLVPKNKSEQTSIIL